VGAENPIRTIDLDLFHEAERQFGIGGPDSGGDRAYETGGTLSSPCFSLRTQCQFTVIENILVVLCFGLALSVILTPNE
jgi:hypothetical protein